jgi:TIR domain
MSFYQIGILGTPQVACRTALLECIQGMIQPFGLALGAGLDVLDPAACLTRDAKAAFSAVYFGGASSDPDSVEALTALVRENNPVIPVVEDLRTFSSNVPPVLQRANGMALGMAGQNFEALAAALLECVGLLRHQRRVFISYRRLESANAALQLHEALGSRGFDVFLDTYDVRPADDFQAIVWHRLCDSDVMVMLDTPGYFGSRWTAAEIGRALAKKIAVLGVVWPDHQPERLSQLREPIFLQRTDLQGSDGPLTSAVVERILSSVERLRSRSLAIRHAAIAGALRSATEEIGGSVVAIGAHRGMKIVLADGRTLCASPAVGVPTAEHFHEAAEYVALVNLSPAVAAPVLVYDHVGLHERWQKHLDWLHENLNVVKTLQITQAAWQLADWPA